MTKEKKEVVEKTTKQPIEEVVNKKTEEQPRDDKGKFASKAKTKDDGIIKVDLSKSPPIKEEKVVEEKENIVKEPEVKEEVQEDLPYLPEVERNKNVDLFVASTKADIRYEVEGKCFYVPSQDFINMSPLNTWNDLEDETKETAYYATLLHELTHWTGNKTRLARDFDYATEELIAELGSAILCGMLGVTKKPMKNHAKYLNVWIKSLKDNPKVIFKASAQAQKAYKYLVDLQPKQEQLKEVA